jgi:hypothetical protein
MIFLTVLGFNQTSTFCLTMKLHSVIFGQTTIDKAVCGVPVKHGTRQLRHNSFSSSDCCHHQMEEMGHLLDEYTGMFNRRSYQRLLEILHMILTSTERHPTYRFVVQLIPLQSDPKCPLSPYIKSSFGLEYRKNGGKICYPNPDESLISLYS